ncbi:hypothetical protein D4R87_03415 [bacterium]|nr:MAG: hypothetical protein D4R87_03415 [bacterium]
MKTLQNAWKITWKNKILWIYGLILSISAGIFIFIDQIGDGSEKLNPAELKTLEDGMQAFAEKHWIGIIIAIIFSLIIFGFIIWASVISKIGLIHETGMAAKDDDKEPQNKVTNIKRGLKKGREKFWRVIGLEVLIAIVEFIVIIAIKYPLSVLCKNSVFVSPRLISLGLTVLILIPFILIFFSIQTFGVRKIIMDDKKIFSAISESYDLFIKFWRKITLTLILFISSIAISGFLYTILCAILLLPVAIIALILAILIGVGYKGLSVGIFIFVIPAIPLCIFFAMMAMVFQESIWSVLYCELKEKLIESK